MKDRAPSIGDRGYSQTGDFSGILKRVEQKIYSKILVRNLHSGNFWYDHELWPQSSGIKQAILENYREIDRIPAVEDTNTYLFSEISILIPNDR